VLNADIGLYPSPLLMQRCETDWLTGDDRHMMWSWVGWFALQQEQSIDCRPVISLAVLQAGPGGLSPLRLFTFHCRRPPAARLRRPDVGGLLPYLHCVACCSINWHYRCRPWPGWLMCDVKWAAIIDYCVARARASSWLMDSGPEFGLVTGSVRFWFTQTGRSKTEK